MKYLSSILFIVLANVALAQIPGINFNGPLMTKYGDFMTGDTLRVGTGSNPDGDFKFIYQPSNGIMGSKQINMPKMYAHTTLEIKHFRRWNSSKLGTIDYTIVRFAGLNAIVDLESAIEAGEIIVKSYNPKPSSSSSGSTADEILKFKKLLDAGAITQEEYDLQKKKLLAN